MKSLKKFEVKAISNLKAIKGGADDKKKESSTGKSFGGAIREGGRTVGAGQVTEILE